MIGEHWDYVSDRARTALYARALQTVVKPGARVLDLGCGVGIFGAMSLREGAASVTAIDYSDVARLARRTLNGPNGNSTHKVIQDSSRRVVLDEPVDLIVCDHVGYFALDYGILDMLIDARERFLRPGGTIVPQAVDLYLAPVEAPDARRPIDGWAHEGTPEDLHWIRAVAANTAHRATLSKSAPLASPAHVDHVSFLSETRTFFSWKETFTIARRGTLHGLSGWFDCTLCEGVKMTNSPLVDKGTEGRIARPQVFLPFADPVAVEAGDQITCKVMTRPDDMVFVWSMTHLGTGRTLRQSTLDGEILDHNRVPREGSDGLITLSALGRTRAIVLSYCDGTRTAKDICEAVVRDHPDILPTREAIERFVDGVVRENAA